MIELKTGKAAWRDIKHSKDVKLGDRVLERGYGEGTVVHFNGRTLVGVKYDKNIHGHTCTGHCADGHGRYSSATSLKKQCSGLEVVK